MAIDKDVIRPIIDYSVKDGKCDVRLSADEMAMLNKLADSEDATKSDIMRKGLHLLFKTYSKE